MNYKQNKKKQQLGMNPSTASHRLTKDILWAFIIETDKQKCHRCFKDMTRENFSIEHKTPWLDSENPLELYFDLGNIAFSHLSCNVASARRHRTGCGTTSSYNAGCRCGSCKAHKQALNARREYSPRDRREKYERLGT